MCKLSAISLALILTSSLAAGALENSVTPTPLQAAEAVQSFGAFAYRVDLETDHKTIDVFDAGGSRMATLVLSLDPEEGTLLDFESEDGTHLSVFWADFDDGVVFTNRGTGEEEVLTAELGEDNQGEGIELIDRHREVLSFIGAIYHDIDQQVFGTLAPPFEDGSLESMVGEVDNGDPRCFGPIVSGYGNSYTANVGEAVEKARRDANVKCSNQWCFGCCEFIGPVICRTIVFLTNCTAKGRMCSNPIPCI